MEEIQELINNYVISKNVFGIEETLDSIVNLTTKDDFTQIIEQIKARKEEKLETETPIQINEILIKIDWYRSDYAKQNKINYR